MVQDYIVRKAKPEEYKEIGRLMITVYSTLKGFPNENEQPDYYKMLANIVDFAKKEDTDLLVAVTVDKTIAGAVVYFGDMQHYGSGGTATKEKNASGFRLLAVDVSKRGEGVGSLLVKECITKAKDKKALQLIIHTTDAMKIAWKMYENMGFKRAFNLDFMQGALKVYGFKLRF
ncbi:GNAT family N-acetyltransferase [uncultured Maribacter sp.]|uniref:GNAT family N-acetyltransferase n=1 Tax=uncultured Maribacter sp. TaxID=431308 RepID=UPI00260DA43A|nr:GNAT family N-acetyltransferase [uncultured Maribacter sp.]